jgi:hypothetical protein
MGDVEEPRQPEPMTLRTLQWDDGEQQHDVVVRLWPPVPCDDHADCEFAIDGLPEPVRNTAHGIDSLQAIVSALTAIRYHLATHREISFLGERGWHGIPLIVPLIDPDEDRYVERMVETELEHFFDIVSRPQKRRAAALAEEYGLRPFEQPHALSSDVLAEMLLEAASGARASRDEEDEIRAYVFEERHGAVAAELRKRPGHEQIFARLGEASRLPDAEDRRS